MSFFEVLDLGLISYQEAYDIQLQVWKSVVQGEKNKLLLLQHPPTYTLGANFHEKNLLFSKEECNKRNIEICSTDRGGDITFHNPGQLVIYPIFNLNQYDKDLHKWLRFLEEIVIKLLAQYGLKGERFSPHTGVWIDQKKIAAIGIKVKKWVSLHGISINCNNDLDLFKGIIPCGISDYGVTSLRDQLKREVDLQEIKNQIIFMLKTDFK